MNKDVIDIMMEKEYHELSVAERDALHELCSSEEEYDHMKSVFVGIENMSKSEEAPRPETKERLDALFHSTYPKVSPVWYMSVLSIVVPKEKPFVRQPLVQIAAVALLALLLIPFWDRVSLKDQPDQLAQLEMVQETPSQASGEIKTPAESPNAAENNLDSRDRTNNTVSQRSRSDENRNQILSEPTMADPAIVADSELLDMTSSGVASTDKVKHPDGVYIAISQPAAEAPEMFDLLTVTF